MAKKRKTWNLRESQKSLWLTMVSAHQAELRPFQNYQEEQRRKVLETFGKELGISPGPGITFDPRSMKFVCASQGCGGKKAKAKPRKRLKLAKTG